MTPVRAKLRNEPADTTYNLDLWRHEPWKVFATAIAASAIAFGMIGGVLGYLLGRIY
jgi:hypothetical protein